MAGDGMKRCDLCGRSGGSMQEVRSRWVDRVISTRCQNVAACNERVRNLGKWTGKRVLRRRDRDGIEWTIRRWDDLGNRGIVGAFCDSGVVLRMTYRDHRLVSQHADVEAAKKHADDLLASWRANSLREYARSQR
jgi:protein gp37